MLFRIQPLFLHFICAASDTVIICFSIDGEWHIIAESKQKHILLNV